MNRRVAALSIVSLAIGGVAFYSLSFLDSGSSEEPDHKKEKPLKEEDIKKAIQNIDKPQEEQQTNPSGTLDATLTLESDYQLPEDIRKINLAVNTEFHQSNTTVESTDKTNGNKRIEGSYDRRPGNLSREEGRKKTNLIREYSVRLSGGSGCTAGFLDYQLPENIHTGYPTKGFLATNIHCILGTYFGIDHYDTTLPAPGSYISPIGLTKERIDIPVLFEDIEFTSWKGDQFRNEYSNGMDGHYSGKSAQGYDIPDDAKADRGTYEDKKPRLVYAAINFLGDKAKAQKLGYPYDNEYYFKDFAVIEINFENEKQARLLTWNFYNKFDPVVGTRKGEAINFMAEELMARKTPEELLQEQEDFFVAGYPTRRGSDMFSVSNYDVGFKKAGRLSTWFHPNMVKNSHGQFIPGHIDSGAWEHEYEKYEPGSILYGNDKPLKSWGYRYFLSGIKLGGGSSGSIITDSSRNLIGLNSYNGLTYGSAEPVRSNGVFKGDKMILPKYDLIQGTGADSYSYKSQIEKYFLPKKITTNLSRQLKGEPRP